MLYVCSSANKDICWLRNISCVQPHRFPLNSSLDVSRKLSIAPHPSSCCRLLRILRIRKKRLPWLQKSFAACRACTWQGFVLVCSLMRVCRVVRVARVYLPSINFPWVSPFTWLGIVCISHLNKGQSLLIATLSISISAHRQYLGQGLLKTSKNEWTRVHAEIPLAGLINLSQTILAKCCDFKNTSGVRRVIIHLLV